MRVLDVLLWCVVSCGGGVLWWWCLVVVSCGGVLWWCVVSCGGGVLWWCVVHVPLFACSSVCMFFCLHVLLFSCLHVLLYLVSGMQVYEGLCRFMQVYAGLFVKSLFVSFVVFVFHCLRL